MNVELAHTINGAACAAWLFKHGLRETLKFEEIDILQSVSIAQIQTASDVVDASDQNQKPVDGRRTFHCTVVGDAVVQLKQFVDSLPKRQSC